VLVSLTLPGGSYLFALPTLPCLLGAGYWLRVERGPTSWRGAVVLAVSAVPALLVLVGLLRFLYSTKLSNAAPMMGIVALLGFLLVPQLEVGRAVSRWALPGGLALVAAALVVVGGLTAEVDPLSFRPWSEVGTPDPDLPATSRPVDLGDELPRAARAALVTYESGRQCLELGDATRSDAEGRSYWCPLRDDLAPPLDFQRAEVDDRTVLFGGVCTDVAEVHIIGPGTDVVIVPTVVGDRRLFAYAAPAAREPPERPLPDEGGRVDVVAVDTGGRELARTVGLDLRPPDDTWYDGPAGAPAVVRNITGC
jgi:hypothetical protein